LTHDAGENLDEMPVEGVESDRRGNNDDHRFVSNDTNVEFSGTADGKTRSFDREELTGTPRGKDVEQKIDEVFEPASMNDEPDEVETIENAETGLVETLEHVQEPVPEDSEETNDDTILFDRPDSEPSEEPEPGQEKDIDIDEILMDDAGDEDDIDGLATGETIVMDRNALRNAAGLSTEESEDERSGEKADPGPAAKAEETWSQVDKPAATDKAVGYSDVADFQSDFSSIGSETDHTERIPSQEESKTQEAPLQGEVLSPTSG
jgi:hypothetical protein